LNTYCARRHETPTQPKPKRKSKPITKTSDFDNLEGDIFCLFHRQDPTNGDSKTENTQPICRICQSLIIGQNDFIDAA
jgi:hypothetical protein